MGATIACRFDSCVSQPFRLALWSGSACHRSEVPASRVGMNGLLDGMALQPLTSCGIRKASFLKKVHPGIVAGLALRLHINVLSDPGSLFFVKVGSPLALRYQSPALLV